MFFMDIPTTMALAPWVMPAMMFMSMATQVSQIAMAKNQDVPTPPAPPTGPTASDADKTAERLKALQADSALTQRARTVANRETAKKTSGKLGLTSSGSAVAGTDKPKITLGAT